MFGAPIFLWGLAAISVPIIVHLMHSPQARVVNFPTIRFLKESKKRAVRRSRIKNILLLLVRIAVIALVALAMARPWLPTRATSVSPSTPISVIIVLDNSYSMGYLEKGRSRLELAREAAIRLIDGLRERDEVAVFLMNEGRSPYIPEFRKDLPFVKKKLREVGLSPFGTNVDPALREAIKLAKKAGAGDPRIHRRVEIVLFTDMQARSWEIVLQGQYIKSLNKDIRLFIIGFGRSDSRNTFIDSVKVAAGGTQEISVVPEVKCIGVAESENIVTLSVDGTNVDQETFLVSHSQPAVVPLSARCPQPGTYHCAVSLQDDFLPIDDRYYFTVDIRDKTSVLIVDGDPVSISSLSETYYVAAALNPGLLVPTATSAIETRVIRVEDLPRTRLDDFRCVVLCNVEKLDGGELVRIEEFLRSGGGLLMFLGDRVNSAEYNDWTFVPIQLTRPEGDKTKRLSFGLGQPSPEHPLFSQRLDLRAARFFLCYGTADKLSDKKARIVARFSNGKPALIETMFGQGRVVMFTSSADIDWNNFPLRRSFVPWLHHIIQYVANQEAQGRSYLLNQEVRFRGLASLHKSTITVIDPLGRESTLKPEVKGGYAEAVYTQTQRPGMYRVKADPGFSNSGGFAVNVDRKESILAMVPPEVIVSAAPEDSVIYIDATKVDIAEELRRAHQGQKLWPLLLKLAVLFFVIESILANFMSRPKELRRKVRGPFEILRRRVPGADVAISP